MTLSQAIEIMQLNLEAGRKEMPYDTAKALSLVTDAATLYFGMRKEGEVADLDLLPGETEH